MSLQAFFALLGGLLVLAFVANRLAQRTRVPDAVVLILTGLLLGPVFHLVNAAQYEDVTRGFTRWKTDRKSTRLNSSHMPVSRMPSSA